MRNSRRQFLKKLGAVTGGVMALERPTVLSSRLGAVTPGHSAGEDQRKIEKGFIQIRNLRKLGVDRVSCERILLGCYYKPCVARLPNDELRLVAECTTPHENVHVDNDHPVFRSRDGGRTWTKLSVPNLTGGEPYFSLLKDGTMLMTGDQFIRNGDRSVACCLHRSEDGGLTWLNPETASLPWKKGDYTSNSRNVFEQADGTLMFMFGRGRLEPPKEIPKTFAWLSFDGGRTWTKKYPAHVEGIPESFEYNPFDEAHLWQARSGKVYALLRLAPQSFPLPGRPRPSIPRGARYVDMRDNWKPGQQPYTGPDGEYLDDYDRIMIYSSADVGRTWKKVSDLGDYGECHYPSILRLKGGRLLLTFTVRAGKDQLGVQAVVGAETFDGFDFDLGHDRILIETKTPMNQVSGGGFGPTVRLNDGTLVTSYSYRLGKTNRDLYSEVVRWRLPEARH